VKVSILSAFLVAVGFTVAGGLRKIYGGGEQGWWDVVGVWVYFVALAVTAYFFEEGGN
jgi:hypothetical protein